MFVKYSKITNAYDDKFITKCFMEVEEGTVFVTTEKLHGTNFSFLVNGKKVKHCSRNNVLTMDTKFFNHKMFVKYHEQLQQIRAKIIDRTPEAQNIQVYGEYVGPGVQKGINYGEADFYVFDIKVDGVYLSFIDTVHLVQLVGMNIVPILLTGTLEMCLQYPNEFNSLLSPDDSENELPRSENICEGVVIKPLYEALYLPTGERVIIKNKNDKWAEKAKMPKRTKTPLTENIKKELDKITPYINENRVNNVISKDVMWQEIDNAKFGKLIQAVIEDICEEVGKTDDDIKPIKKFISREVAKTVRKICFN